MTSGTLAVSDHLYRIAPSQTSCKITVEPSSEFTCLLNPPSHRIAEQPSASSHISFRCYLRQQMDGRSLFYAARCRHGAGPIQCPRSRLQCLLHKLRQEMSSRASRAAALEAAHIHSVSAVAVSPVQCPFGCAQCLSSAEDHVNHRVEFISAACSNCLQLSSMPPESASEDCRDACYGGFCPPTWRTRLANLDRVEDWFHSSSVLHSVAGHDTWGV